MTNAISFAPLIPWQFLAVAGAITLIVVLYALWRGLSGWWLRGLAGIMLLIALADPSLKQEDRDYLRDVAILVVDETASQRIDIRPGQMEAAEKDVIAQIAELDRSTANAGIDLRVVRVGDGTGADASRGSLVAKALAEAAAEVSTERLAGAILLTDGQIHDADSLKEFPAPVHTILTGRSDEWDRRIVLETVPAFAIVGESVDLTLKIETLGDAPFDENERAPILISINGENPQSFEIPMNKSITLPIQMKRGGMNVMQVTVPSAPGELTERNNSAVISINGIRDRLRVLLVSGEPYPGERTWRNLLKSDSAVDLVHFTILRPPEKQDGVPVFELSLIAFPTRELFMDKVDEFDLIIFDRYRRRGVLPTLYIENIARYVKEGGAVLIASGPSFAAAESLYRTPLRDVLPAAPTARVLEEGFVPAITDIGKRHPVTRGLEEFAPRPTSEDGTPGWGRWFRLIEMETIRGNAIMSGPEDRPLLILDRVGEGRIAMLASDQAWLWSRGFEGGGPQQEMLRRLAHWLMKEPELEEEVLVAEPSGAEVTVTRRSLGEEVSELIVTAPSGETQVLTLDQVAPGEWQSKFEATENGIYRLAEGDTKTVTAIGPAAPKEFENPLSSSAALKPLADATGGGILRMTEAGAVPDIRRVREGRVAHGRAWIGLEQREAFDVRDIRLTPLAPGWLILLLASSLIFIAWRLEGR